MSAEKHHWPKYNPQEIEPAWQQRWEASGLYLADDYSDKPKYYCLDFFPYPSGEGLHVGHCRNYLPTDVISRYKRMRGFNVLRPMGWDAFGEPAEQYAVAHGVHPSVTTRQNASRYRQQMTMIGNAYDWSREFASSDPEFYHWTQWIFLRLYERGLAYRDTNWQWWCPGCQTTLSSHEVSNGVCWRGHTGVTRKEVPAWYFRITAYADELLSGLEEIDWPDPIKALQRNWIGRSEGVEIDFPLAYLPERPVDADRITVFTTRPDTLFGVTYLVLAPEHDLVKALATQEQRGEVEAYLEQAARQSEVERMLENRPKTGVFSGAYARNPLSGEEIPVWVADYVLPGYGTGAVMGVPGHDSRDFAFARQYDLPVMVVIIDTDNPSKESDAADAASEAYGTLVDSDGFSDMSSQDAIPAITAALESKGLGRRAVRYRMHDWLISRQRYWGTPIPIVYCRDCGEVPVPEDQLPVLLPPMDNFEPDGTGRSPLRRVPDFVNTTCPRCGGPAERETDTMGGFACSSWYFLRFTSPHYDQGPFDPALMRYWMPVDLYVGGAEHATLHLLYARFWTKVLADAGLLPFREPFAVLRNQGQLLGPDGSRMSKSRGNVITPDEMVATYGADSLRLYEMFMAPFEQDIAWSTEGIRGARRFLQKVWRLYGDSYAGSVGATATDPELERLLHQTIRAVGERIEGLRMNTMVSALMEFGNALSSRRQEGTWQTSTFHSALDTFLVLLAPAAPHITDELWQITGHSGSVHQQPWPSYDPELVIEGLWQVAVQVNGRLRDVLEVSPGAGQEAVLAAAMQSDKVRAHLGGEPDRVIWVPGKILNLVTRKLPPAKEIAKPARDGEG